MLVAFVTKRKSGGGFFGIYNSPAWALRGIAITSLQVEKRSFVALSASIDLGGDLIRTEIYLYHGYFDWAHWFYIPMLMLAAYLGSLVGKYFLSKIPQHHFEKIVMGFVFFSGLTLLLDAEL